VQGNVKVIQTALEQYASDFNGSYPLGYVNNSLTYDGAGNSTADKLDAYLPGGKIPSSPWAAPGKAQTVIGGPTYRAGAGSNTGVQTASNVAGGSALTAFGTSMAGAGVVPDLPSMSAVKSRFGALLLDYDSGSGVYVIYGCGKSRGASILVSAKSNNGN
jgi:hypothetical protein